MIVMSVASVKQLIKKIVFPTYTHEKIYVIDQTNLTKKLQFSTTLKPLGKWYITTGNHWLCHSELTLDDFQKNSFNKLKSLLTKLKS
ncbi:hypothetical protein SGGBAA2069_c19690 [Streptococcus gallolyticus subsp. gallolyticus ATCC BAA-2069]|nr:hypothetical protein SGGBAA2069_c19690 [Streptococcus gallolyticus subsp. gallolyticus ATCC BAA-2069]